MIGVNDSNNILLSAMNCQWFLYLLPVGATHWVVWNYEQ